MTSEPAAGPPSHARLGALARLAGAHRWAIAFTVVGLAIVLQRLAALDTAPRPLYIDEAAFGYNAWALANHGVDEYGHSWPLFFESFRDYKSPAYAYALVPLTRILGLSPAVERLPAALSGIAVCVLLALTAHRITRSRGVAMLVLLTAAVEPWLVVENRVGFDVNAMMLCLAGAIWALTHAAENRPRWFFGTGLWLGAAVFSYQTGRIFAPMLCVAIWAAFGMSFERHRRRARGWVLSIVPVVAAYVVIIPWSLNHPGALGARFTSIGITSGNASPLTVVHRFVNNYVQYWGAPFLATHGDANLRHDSGFGGELLIVTLPAILLGIGVCARRWREPLPRFTLLGLLLAPVLAALSLEGTPHSLRAAVMLPFLLLASVYGWQRMLPLLQTRRLAAAVLAVAAVVEGVAFFSDLYHYWPQRSALAFGAGLGPAIVHAHVDAGTDHEVVVSDRFEAPYIVAYFYLQPDPNLVARDGLQALHVRVGRPETAAPGDVIVVGPGERAPRGSILLWQDTMTVDSPVDIFGQPRQTQVVVASVWRRG